MRYLLVVIGVGMLLAGVYGAVRGDWGGSPFIVIGVAAVVFALWKRGSS